MSNAMAEVSFRDPAGFVSSQRGELRRQVNLVDREHSDRLMGSGLSGELVDAGLLIPHEELEAEGGEPSRADTVIWSSSCRRMTRKSAGSPVRVRASLTSTAGRRSSDVSAGPS
jgi:hypothetical protein